MTTKYVWRKGPSWFNNGAESIIVTNYDTPGDRALTAQEIYEYECNALHLEQRGKLQLELDKLAQQVSGALLEDDQTKLTELRTQAALIRAELNSLGE